MRHCDADSKRQVSILLYAFHKNVGRFFNLSIDTESLSFTQFFFLKYASLVVNIFLIFRSPMK